MNSIIKLCPRVDTMIAAHRDFNFQTGVGRHGTLINNRI